MDKSQYALTELSAAADALVNESMETLPEFVSVLAGMLGNDGRLLIAGTGEMGGVADLIAARFQHKTFIERPALPAISLTQNQPLMGLVSPAEFFDRQVRVIARPGDWILILASGEDAASVAPLLSLASTAECRTALLFSGDPESCPVQPDFYFFLPAQSPMRRVELALFFGQLLCELVEEELFGF